MIILNMSDTTIDSLSRIKADAGFNELYIIEKYYSGAILDNKPLLIDMVNQDLQHLMSIGRPAVIVFNNMKAILRNDAFDNIEDRSSILLEVRILISTLASLNDMGHKIKIVSNDDSNYDIITNQIANAEFEKSLLNLLTDIKENGLMETTGDIVDITQDDMYDILARFE